MSLVTRYKLIMSVVRGANPANTRHRPNVETMLVYDAQHRVNIGWRCVVFSGKLDIQMNDDRCITMA